MKYCYGWLQYSLQITSWDYWFTSGLQGFCLTLYSIHIPFDKKMSADGADFLVHMKNHNRLHISWNHFGVPWKFPYITVQCNSFTSKSPRVDFYCLATMEWTCIDMLLILVILHRYDINLQKSKYTLISISIE